MAKGGMEKSTMTTKELVVDAIRSQGYDFVTACEICHKWRMEVIDLLPGKYVYVIGNIEIKFIKPINE